MHEAKMWLVFFVGIVLVGAVYIGVGKYMTNELCGGSNPYECVEQ